MSPIHIMNIYGCWFMVVDVGYCWFLSIYEPHSHHEYLSNRKNPGNTKYVFDGHWFMEIDGNC